MQINNKNKGFTLLEISIVLVVIGFIVGVVLFARDIIVAAKVRAVITQIERYNAATNIFRDKYSHLPGDIPFIANTPWSSFFNTPGLASATIGGNGNGLIHSGTSAAPTTDVSVLDIAATGREFVHYFNHLSALGLIDFYGNGSTAAVTIGSNFPFTKLADNIGFGLAVYAGFRRSPVDAVAGVGDVRNYWYLGVSQRPSAASEAIRGIPSLNQDEAFMIDTKLDDGMPFSGTVMAFGSSSSTVEILENRPVRQVTATPINTGACVEGPAPITTFTVNDVYNIKTRSPVCNLRIRAAF